MTTSQARGQVRTPDWSRLVRANEPKLLQPIPALSTPVESANVVLNKQTATLNRAGSGSGNPILAGLGVTAQIGMGLNDRLIGLFLYQTRGMIGNNLVDSAAIAGQVATFTFRAGSGNTVAGTPATGAVKNFLRWQTEAGAIDKEFWIKNYDPDIVTLNGTAALDPTSLLPVPVMVEIVDAGLPWLTVNVDFMPSWNDEFQALALAGSQPAAAGFKKAYGGALFVSFFDQTPGEEGIGVQVNPITQEVLATQRSIQIQNTAGLKQIIARFRSMQDSSFFVDVPIEILVNAAAEETCDLPFSEPCSSAYLKAGTPCPADCPEVASTPGVQVVAGTVGDILAQDLLVISIHGTSVGAAPKLRIRTWQWVANSLALAGADLQQTGSDADYLPLILSGDSPVEPFPYGSPHRLTIALSVIQLKADLVAFIEVYVLDGADYSPAILIPGPRARDVGLLPIGGAGGGAICAY